MIAERATGRLLLIQRRQSERRTLVTPGEAGASAAAADNWRLTRVGVSRSSSGPWASLLYPPYSPNLNPVQQLLAKLKPCSGGLLPVARTRFGRPAAAFWTHSHMTCVPAAAQTGARYRTIRKSSTGPTSEVRAVPSETDGSSRAQMHAGRSACQEPPGPL